ncbi:hypothetical protein RHGRI_014138 [Rhododendron griersonianum]|uniref:GRF-type domain-containing protein n=1 Tax=Rhododendron griersonianum TaxID=479676 RepID=A0AAV6K8M0_9ERIC|nr:hypothetical protein RHGRI_014138 [Rhododendron griersonianum]
MASSSSATTQYEYPTCLCGNPAPLRRSKTIANPGRRFLGCANYEIKEKRCKYFYWVDPPTRENELEPKNAELEHRLEDMEKKNQQLNKENKKLKKKLMAVEAKMNSYKLWCIILMVVCIMYWFTTKNGHGHVRSVKYLP